MHSLLTLGSITLLCCIFRLQEVITTLVVVRILFQFLLQGDGCVVAEAPSGKETARISYAALSPSGIACPGRLRLHSIFATQFFTGDADGGIHSDRWGRGIRASLLEDAESSLADRRIGASWSSILF
jgi:hypothetical protein